MTTRSANKRFARNPNDGLHKTAYGKQWEFWLRQLAIGGFIGGLIAFIVSSDLLGSSGAANVVAAIGALFAALAMTFSSDAELQTRRDSYRAEREALQQALLEDIEKLRGEDRDQALVDYHELLAAGSEPAWHHATLRIKRLRASRELNRLTRSSVAEPPLDDRVQ